MDSTSDERVVNNVMRHEYKVLSDAEKVLMKGIKDKGLDFFSFLTQVAMETHTYGEQVGSRELSVAKTKIEEAVMWAVKHITK